MKRTLPTVAIAAAAIGVIAVLYARGNDAEPVAPAHEASPGAVATPLAPQLDEQRPRPRQAVESQLAPSDDAPVIVDEKFALIYSEFVEAARLTPEQDRHVRAILADVQVNAALISGDAQQWQREQDIVTHLSRGRRWQNSPEGEYHRREAKRIGHEASSAVSEQHERIEADADARLREVLSPPQLRIFRALLTVGEVQLVRPFDV